MRKIFITLLILAAMSRCLPIAKAQQQAKVPRIGILLIGSPPAPSRPTSANLAAFRQGLRELGHIEGQNIVIEYRYAEGRPERFPELAADLVRLNADVIVASGGPAGLNAARNATKTIPIVMTTTPGDPVAAGLIASLARPGGNITGLTQLSETSGKRMELLKEIIPKLSRVAVLWEAGSPFILPKEAEDAARSLRLKLLPFEVRGPDDFNGALGAAVKDRAGAVWIAGTPLFGIHRKRLPTSL